MGIFGRDPHYQWLTNGDRYQVSQTRSPSSSIQVLGGVATAAEEVRQMLSIIKPPDNTAGQTGMLCSVVPGPCTGSNRAQVKTTRANENWMTTVLCFTTIRKGRNMLSSSNQVQVLHLPVPAPTQWDNGFFDQANSPSDTF